MKNISGICRALNATMLSADETSWDIYQELNNRLGIKGKLVPDAVLASILEANGISRVYTHDRDFWKFPGLKPIDPFKR